MITNLYIDGFNLYYRALKDTPFRWLDLRRLAETLFPPGLDQPGLLLHRAARRPSWESLSTPAAAGVSESPGDAAGLRRVLRRVPVRCQAASTRGACDWAAVLRPGKGLGGEGDLLSMSSDYVRLSPNPPMRSGLGVRTRGEGRGTRRSALDSDKWGRWRPLVVVGGADGGPGQRRWGGVGGTVCRGRQSRTGPVRLCGAVG